MDFLMGCSRWRPSRMPRANEENTKVWLFVLKLPLMILVSVAAFNAMYRYKDVAKHREAFPDTTLYNNAEFALYLTYITSMILFPWCLCSTVLLHWLHGLSIFFIGILDLTLAVSLATGLGAERNFLPDGMKACVGAANWKVNGESGFFSRVAGVAHFSSPQAACESFVYTWELAGSALFFQFFVTYLGIFCDEREGSILNPWRPIFNLCFLIFAPPFLAIAFALPRIRFAWRYIIKALRRIHSKDLEFETPTPYTPRYNYRIQSPKLLEILNIEHVLLEIVENMHYEDVIDFSLTSRAVREAVFPGRDLAMRVPKLKKHCCDKSSKNVCLYCNKKICGECRTQKFWINLPASRHVNCVPWCSKCYYQHDARRPAGYVKPCKCRASDRTYIDQYVCRTCGKYPDSEFIQLQKKRHKRFEKEIRDKAMGKHLPPGEDVKCTKCQKELKDGARFWKCGLCNGECRDSIHPGFVPRRKEQDLEKGSEDTEAEASVVWSWTAIFKMRNR